MGARPEEIYAELLVAILDEKWPPQSRLPPERELAAQHDTNRNTIREAIRRLEQARLVTVRQGQGLTVQDFRDVGTLELVAPFMKHGRDAREKVQMLMDLAPIRRLLSVQMAVTAAERRTEEDLTALRDTAVAVRIAENSRDRARFGEAQVAFGTAVLDSTHSLGLRWLANPLVVVANEIFKARPEIIIYEPSFSDMAESATEAIAHRDPELARSIADTYFAESNRELSILLGAEMGLHADAPSAT